MKQLAGVVLLGLCSSALANVEFLWGVTGVAGAPSSFYAINPANGQLYGLVGGSGQVCLSGLEIQPGTGELLAVQGQLSPSATSPKTLFRVDRTSGVATAIASMNSKYAISDVAMRADGTMFAFGVMSTVKKLLTVNTTSGAVTEIGNTNDIQNVSMTFGSNGTLYLARTNALFTVNTTTGAMTQVDQLTGATQNISNFMATRSNGAIYVGRRIGGNTTLYVINPATAVTTLVGTVPGVALSGIVFDSAAPPTLSVSGGRNRKVKAASIRIAGKAAGIGAKVTVNGRAARVVNGAWNLKAKLKKGRNRLLVQASDVFGQATVPVRMTITRRAAK